MYNDYFGLREAPFSIAPNPQYLFMSPRHREALAHLLYGIQSDGGFILLTGEVGTGKTTVCRCLLEQIPEDVDTAYILNPKQTAQELLATACDEFGIQYPQSASIKVLVDLLNQFLLDAHQQGRKSVLIIDEAQNLSADVLEQLRLLTNLETNQRKLLQIILLGQPELLELLARQELRQLSQRVTARFHLDALNKDEVTNYIQHRLDTAGAKGSLFPPSTVKRIYQISGGIPRLINLVCDRALLGTYVQNKLQVDVTTVNNAAKEILGPSNGSNRSWVFAAAAAVILGIGGWFALNEFAAPPLSEETVVAQNSAQVPEQITEEGESQNPATANDLAVETNTQPAVTEVITPPETIEENILARVEPPLESQEAISAAVLVPTEAAEPEQPQTTKISDIEGYESQAAAFQKLLAVWGVDAVIGPQSDPCEVADVSSLQCLSKLGSLRDVAHMNRPVVLNLTTATSSQWFVVNQITAAAVTVTTDSGEYQIAAEEFLSVWRGYYTLLWRTPPAYSGPAQRGDQGATVDWLQSQLAKTDGSQASAVPPGSPFDLRLETRVKRFQISVGLVPDGIVGPQTWIHLNSVDESDVPRLD